MAPISRIAAPPIDQLQSAAGYQLSGCTPPKSEVDVRELGAPKQSLAKAYASTMDRQWCGVTHYSLPQSHLWISLLIRCAVSSVTVAHPSFAGARYFFETPVTLTAMPNLCARVTQTGISREFVRRSLPVWWEDSIAETPAGLQQACLYLAQAFNLDPRSIYSVGAEVRFRTAERKFKLSRNMKEADVEPSANYASAMARLALAAFTTSPSPISSDPIELRKTILSACGIVNLESLLAWCGRVGIPVMHIADMPAKKMLAVAIRSNGKFAIVLSRKGTTSEMLFWLAHELGHIALGHLVLDGFLADEKEAAEQDTDEVEANDFAIKLLNGRPANYALGHFMTAQNFAAAAVQYGKANAIDPGHVILNVAKNMKAFALGKAALKFLTDQDDACAKVNRSFRAHAELERLSGDQAALLGQSLTQ
jgi:Zn-dependent peptidase ImmA (M78 family)